MKSIAMLKYADHEKKQPGKVGVIDVPKPTPGP